MRVTRKTGLLLALALLLGASVLLPANASADHDEGPTSVYFPTTGHTVADDFLSYWRHTGGLVLYGYPLSEVVTDSKTNLPTQYFERAVFERHANNPAEWRVLLRRLGAGLTVGREDEQPFQPIPDYQTTGCDYFDLTDHRVCAGFKAYWETHGGLPVFGYPLSEEFSERNPDTGQTYTVQYFERARFEWHPENQPPWNILGGHLGRMALTS